MSFHLLSGPFVLNNKIRLALSVKDAIAEGIHPKMISKGSSGSYFARAKVDGKVQTVAYVFSSASTYPRIRLPLLVSSNRRTKNRMAI